MSSSGEPVLQTSYDWAAIKAHARDLYFINSRHDPYGCDDKQGRAMFERLGGTQIVRDDGHFGTGDQPYEIFELLDKLIDWRPDRARRQPERGRPAVPG